MLTTRQAGLVVVFLALPFANAVAQPFVETLLKDVNTTTSVTLSSGPTPMAVMGSVVLFSATDSFGNEVWRTDGTAAGTYQVKDIGMPDGSPEHAVSLPSGEVFFIAEQTATGREPWVTDGTDPGTRMLLDIEPGPAASEIDAPPVLFQGEAWFVAETSANGRELWKSDGTSAGTQLGIETVAGAGSDSPEQLTVSGNRLFFRSTMVSSNELRVTDGTPAGTQTLFSAPTSFQCLTALVDQNGVLLFNGCDAAGQLGLWRSDGTVAGTFPIAGVNPGAFCASGGVAFFSGTDALGKELWVTDGTAAGTQQVLDIKPGAQWGVASFTAFAFGAGSCSSPMTARLAMSHGLATALQVALI